jgi:hypothetical protein
LPKPEYLLELSSTIELDPEKLGNIMIIKKFLISVADILGFSGVAIGPEISFSPGYPRKHQGHQCYEGRLNASEMRLRVETVPGLRKASLKIKSTRQCQELARAFIQGRFEEIFGFPSYSYQAA